MALPRRNSYDGGGGGGIMGLLDLLSGGGGAEERHQKFLNEQRIKSAEDTAARDKLLNQFKVDENVNKSTAEGAAYDLQKQFSDNQAKNSAYYTVPGSNSMYPDIPSPWNPEMRGLISSNLRRDISAMPTAALTGQLATQASRRAYDNTAVGDATAKAEAINKQYETEFKNRPDVRATWERAEMQGIDAKNKIVVPRETDVYTGSNLYGGRGTEQRIQETTEKIRDASGKVIYESPGKPIVTTSDTPGFAIPRFTEDEIAAAGGYGGMPKSSRTLTVPKARSAYNPPGSPPAVEQYNAPIGPTRGVQRPGIAGAPTTIPQAPNPLSFINPNFQQSANAPSANLTKPTGKIPELQLLDERTQPMFVAWLKQNVNADTATTRKFLRQMLLQQSPWSQLPPE